jgi:hypothetical protein
MNNKQQNQSDIRLAEIERLVDTFKENFKARTSDVDNFITIHEIERMWGELQRSTLNIYSDIVCDLMSGIDESDLIRKKKESTPKKA